MNMFLHELKAYRKSLIIWTFSISIVAVLFLSMYPTFANNAADVQKLFNGYPESLRKAMGMEDVTSILGYYTFIFTYVILCGAIQAMNLGTSIVSKEIREKTADFLLTKPVTRQQILTAKLLAAFTSLVITNIIFLGTVCAMASYISTTDYSMNKFIMISLSMFYVQLIFMALGIIISVIVPKIKSVITISLSTVFGFLVVGLFTSAIGDENIRYITPFKYFDPIYIRNNGAYETRFIVITIIFIITAIAASYLLYTKKDIHAVN